MSEQLFHKRRVHTWNRVKVKGERSHKVSDCERCVVHDGKKAGGRETSCRMSGSGGGGGWGAFPALGLRSSEVLGGSEGEW